MAIGLMPTQKQLNMGSASHVRRLCFRAKWNCPDSLRFADPPGIWVERGCAAGHKVSHGTTSGHLCQTRKPNDGNDVPLIRVGLRRIGSADEFSATNCRYRSKLTCVAGV